jgi:hypothetical protein
LRGNAPGPELEGRCADEDPKGIATPDYLAKSGRPDNPCDPAMHKRVGWTFVRALGG